MSASQQWQRLSGFKTPRSPLAATLRGFQDLGHEEEYQACFAEEAGKVDSIANASFFALMVTCIWTARDASSIEAVVIALGTLCAHGLWAWVSRWEPSAHKARCRALAITAIRAHNIFVVMCMDRMVLTKNFQQSSTVMFVHNLVTVSRIVVMVIFVLGMQLPFRMHVPLHTIVTLAFLLLNQDLCNKCSSGMQAHFLGAAEMLSRIAGASTLLTPQATVPQIHPSHACLAVSALLFLAFAAVMPSVILFFWEAQSRAEFMKHRTQPADVLHSRPSLANLALRDAGSISMLPLVLTVATLPVASMLWNCIIIADKLL